MTIGESANNGADKSGNSGGPIFNLKGQLIGVSVAMLDKNNWKNLVKILLIWVLVSKIYDKESFKYEKSVPVKSVKYDKVAIYEKMLPSIAFVVSR